jgi:hypothetical protein
MKTVQPNINNASFVQTLIYSGFTSTQIRSGRLSRSQSHYKDFLDLRGDGRVMLCKGETAAVDF